MKVLEAIWFTNRDGCTGIVRAETDFDGVKYFIGHVSGYSEKDDAQYVADYGSSFSDKAGDILFGV